MHSHFVKPTRCFVLLVILLGLLLGTDALAQDIPPLANPLTYDLVQTDNSSGGAALDGFVTNDLLVSNEGRLLGFQMMLFLDEGSIYQDPLGTNLPPTKLAVEAVAPSLAYDTFIAVGSPYANGDYGISGPYGLAVDIIGIVGRAGPPVLDEQRLDVAWSTAPGEEVAGVNDFLLSRVTLSNDARGYWSFLSSAFSTSNGYNYQYQARVGLRDQFPFSEGLGKIADGVMEFPPNIHYFISKAGKVSRPRPPVPLGESLRLVEVDNSSGGPSLTGFVTNDLLLDTEDRLSSFLLYLELDHGEIFQDPLGSNVAPAAGLAEKGFPSLKFDTFIALGTETADGPYGTPGIAGGAAELGGSISPQVEFDDDTLSIVWYGALGEPMFGFEDFLLSRISLSEDAIGKSGLAGMGALTTPKARSKTASS